VCYYPEHWPEDNWAKDAQRMFEVGIRMVRIGEFAWSKLEAVPGTLTFDWLRRAIDTLHNAGLEVVLGTPTATPPRWMLDKYPDLLAVDEHGQSRGFGSRRHYCFSHLNYREECKRIVTALAKEFGNHPGVVGWQTDNEYGCHDTIPSYSTPALLGFQQWCKNHYQTIDALNVAWGNVFWSMDYNTFEQIGFPVAAVTETNPAHRLAFWRYSSDQVVAFNRVQTDVIRTLSPGRDLIHNYMGNFVQYDHHEVAKDLDVASWDNYPLGFLTRDGYSEQEQATYLRTGHPDSSAFHHDLYRGCNQGRAPLPGMVRFWGWEAIAHGAEVVSYFRWRQCPFAQEQMHTGLCLPNNLLDVGGEEVRVLGEELLQLQNTPNNASLFEQTKAPVALVFDYTGVEAQRIQQPDGKTFDPLSYAQRVYGACRQLGLNVDVVSAAADVSKYDAVMVTSNTIVDADFIARLKLCRGTLVLMPRVGSKTFDNNIPNDLPPGLFQQLIPIKVHRVESLPDFIQLPLSNQLTAQHWRESILSEIQPEETFEDGLGFHYRYNNVHYLNACLNETSLVNCLSSILVDAGIPVTRLPDGVRTRVTKGAAWAFNFGPNSAPITEPLRHAFGLSSDKEWLLGGSELPPGGVAMWRT